MKDELFDRDFQLARTSLNGAIDQGLMRLRTAIATAFRLLSRRQWSAPWKKETACR